MTKDGRFIVFRTYSQLEILGGMENGELNIVQQISSFWTPTSTFSGNSKFLVNAYSNGTILFFVYCDYDDSGTILFNEEEKYCYDCHNNQMYIEN